MGAKGVFNNELTIFNEVYMAGSEGWNIAKGFLDPLGTGWLDGIGGSIDRAVNPEAYKTEQPNQSGRGGGEQLAPRGGMFMNNINPYYGSGQYQSGQSYQPYGNLPPMTGQQSNQNNGGAGLFSGLGSLFGGGGNSGGSGGLGDIVSMGMKFLPLLLAEGGYAGHRSHYEDGGMVTGDNNYPFSGQGNSYNFAPPQARSWGLGSVQPYGNLPPMTEQQYGQLQESRQSGRSGISTNFGTSRNRFY